MGAVRGTDPPRSKAGNDRQDGTRYTDKGPGGAAGNLVEDPTLRWTPAGRAIVSLRIADKERVQVKGGSGWADGETKFYDLSVWGDQGLRAAEYLIKGDRVAAIGRWQLQEWDDPEQGTRNRMVLVCRDLGASLLFKPVRIYREAGEDGK